jgi:alpha-L-rhamnosidase
MNKSTNHLICLSAACMMMLFQAKAASPNPPDHLRCCDKYDPVGTNHKPYFGWYVNDPDDHEIQSAYQIIVASSPSNLTSDKGDIWNSEKVVSRKQNYVFANGKEFSPATRYFWKVRTWDKDGNVSPYSSMETFETGLLANSDWEGAKWIKRNSNAPDDYTYFRKKTALPEKKIERATVYVAACHSYELYVNDKFIGKGFDHHYPSYSYYNAWDVSAAFISGSENIIACLTHWYGGGQGRATGARGLLMKIIIEYADSTKTIIGTDSTWKQTQAEQWVAGQPQRNSEGVGRVEKYDSRKVIDHWNALNLDDSSWQFATEIGTHPVEPWTGTLRADLTRVIEEEIKPVSISNLGNGKQVIDLGKIYPGSFKITFSGGNAGDTIQMLGGFVLNNDGTVSSKFNQQTNLNFYFIHNGNTAVFNPSVYLGLRYLQVNNAPNVLDINNVRFVCRHFELDPSRSEFNSSNRMLNSVWDLMCHSLMNGSQEDFVDTPTREKGSFLGDGWSQSVPAMSTMGDRTMSLRALQEFLDSQDQYWPDGRLNAVYPNADGGRDIPDYTQSYLVWVWDYYMQTGNIDFIKAHYLKLKKIADYVYTYRNDTTGLIHHLEGGKGSYQYGIVDWPMNMRYGYDMSVESRTVIDAYAYLDFELISKMAGLVGNTADSVFYKSRSTDIKTAINSKLINKDGVYIDGLNQDKTQSLHVSQHANAFPLAMGMVPRRNIKKVIAEVKKRKMNVGMVCLRWLPEALGKADQGAHLIDLYTNTEWDGWAKIITLGGSVTWESWDANVTNESMSHPWGAVGLLAMQQYILGITPLKPQHEFIQIKPLDFENKLSYAKGVYPTDKGDILVNWSKSNRCFLMTVTIPDNVTAKVYVPKGRIKGASIIMDGLEAKGVEEGDYVLIGEVGSGVHTFKRCL